jgi:hypothetical protein
VTSQATDPKIGSRDLVGMDGHQPIMVETSQAETPHTNRRPLREPTVKPRLEGKMRTSQASENRHKESVRDCCAPDHPGGGRRCQGLIERHQPAG